MAYSESLNFLKQQEAGFSDDDEINLPWCTGPSSNLDSFCNNFKNGFFATVKKVENNILAKSSVLESPLDLPNLENKGNSSGDELERRENDEWPGKSALSQSALENDSQRIEQKEQKRRKKE